MSSETRTMLLTAASLSGAISVTSVSSTGPSIWWLTVAFALGRGRRGRRRGSVSPWLPLDERAAGAERDGGAVVALEHADVGAETGEWTITGWFSMAGILARKAAR